MSVACESKSAGSWRQRQRHQQQVELEGVSHDALRLQHGIRRHARSHRCMLHKTHMSYVQIRSLREQKCYRHIVS
jgi:hypothetical protein